MLKKIIIAFTAVIVILASAAGVLIKVMVTPERVRTSVLPLVEKRLDRKISYTDIRIGIFSGIYVSDLKIMNRHDAHEWVWVGKIALHYRLFPLLWGNVEISEIVLDQPKIAITRFPDGSFNFSDLIPASAPGASSSDASSPTETQPPTHSGSGMNLQVAKVQITNGELNFLDQAINPKSPFNCVLRDFNFKSTNITLEKAFPIEMSARINGAPIHLSGTYNVKTAQSDMAVKLDTLDIVFFSPYFAGQLPGRLGSAKVSIDLDARTEADTVSSKGALRIDQLDLKMNAFPDVPIEKAVVSLDYDMGVDTAKKAITLSPTTFSFNGMTVSGKGNVQLAPQTPVVDLSVILDAFDLQNLMTQAPTGLTQKYKDYQLKGRVSGNMQLAGAIDQGPGLLKTATLDLSGITATVNKAIAEVSGKLSWSDNQLKTNGMDFKYAGEGGKLTLDMAYHQKAPIIRGNFALTAKQINLNAVMGEPDPTPEKSAAATASPASPKSAAAAEEAGPFNIPADVRGLITADEILYRKLPIQLARAELSLKNNQLTVDKISAQVAGGTVDSTATVNLGVKGLAYQGKLKLSETEIKELVLGLLPDTQLDISGKTLASASFSGKGTLPENLISALEISGNAKILKGLVKETKLQQTVSLFLGVSEIKLLSFQSLNTDLDMKNALIHLNTLLDSSNLQIKSNGTISAEKNKDLDLLLDLRIAPDLMARARSGNLTKYMTDERGWGRIVLNLNGTPDDPTVGLDPTALKETTQQVIKEKLTEKITEKLSEKRGNPTAGEDQTQSKPGADALQNLLKNVLK